MHFVTYLFYKEGTDPDEIMEQFDIQNPESQNRELIYNKKDLIEEARSSWQRIEKDFPEYKGKQDDDDIVFNAAKEYYDYYEYDSEGNAYEYYNTNGYYDYCTRAGEPWFRFTDWADVDGKYVKDVIDKMKAPYYYVDINEEWRDADSYLESMKEELEKEFWDEVKSYGDDIKVAVYDCHE